MSTAAPSLMTTEEFLALPDDGVDRQLIRGVLREGSMTKRNRHHSRTVTQLAFLLERWLRTQPERRGEVHTGEVGAILRHDPDSTVGIDVAYFSADVIARQTDTTTMIDGVPTLAVEVLSPSDKHEDVRDKVLEYLNAGVDLVWIVDPDFQTIQVHRPGKEPETFNRRHTVTGGDVLPGLELAVCEIFQREHP